MIYNLNFADERESLKARLEKLALKGATIEVKERKERTLTQNRYLHVIIGYFACEYGISAEEAKVDYFKRAANRQLFEREIKSRRGQTIKCLRSTTELTSEEMTLAIDRFRHWSSIEAGIYLPSPEDGAFIEQAEREIERNKEFV